MLKFKNRTELSDYLMLKYDNSWGQDTAHTFINALKLAAMYSAKEVADVAAAPTMRWTLALWDEDQQEICVVKYHS